MKITMTIEDNRGRRYELKEWNVATSHPSAITEGPLPAPKKRRTVKRGKK